MIDSAIFNLTIELFFGFIGLLIAVKIIGKRQVHQVSPFDFVSAVVLGELLGNAIYSKDTTIFHIIYALALWTLLLFLIEKITQKSIKFRTIVEGTPKLVIKNGLIDYDVLKKEKLSFDELLSELRHRGAFSIREVKYAIMEPSGIITVIKKSAYTQSINSQQNAKHISSSLSLPLIMEGQILTNNLTALGHDEKWLIDIIKNQNIQSLNDILYAEFSEKEGFYYQKNNPQNK